MPSAVILPGSEGRDYVDHIGSVQHARQNAGENLPFNELIERTVSKRNRRRLRK